MEDLHTIEETVELPSKGLIYERPINPVIKLRSMTTQDEMLRLAPSENVFKVGCDLIENCIISDKPAMSVYDMCLGDYYALMHQLRIVTYGTEYKMLTYCPYCQDTFEAKINLDDIHINGYDDTFKDLLEVKLPKSGKVITLTYQTPRIMDDISKRLKQIKEKNKEASDEVESMILKLVFSIVKVDGKTMGPVELEAMLRRMNMMDTNFLSQKIDILNEKLGPSRVITTECSHCGNTVLSLFRYTSEFFRPTID